MVKTSWCGNGKGKGKGPRLKKLRTLEMTEEADLQLTMRESLGEMINEDKRSSKDDHGSLRSFSFETSFLEQ